MTVTKLLKSRYTFAAILVIAIFQINVLRTQDANFGKPRWQTERVIRWDVQEYYMYLPATFIYHDPEMKYLDTLKGPVRDHYWVGKSPTGKWIGRFSIGMAIAYSPFFFFADAIANISGAPRNGFSQPYEFGLYICGFMYSLVGFLFLGLALSRFFNDKITALTLLCIGLGTNLFYYSTSEGAMAHAVLFCLCSVFLFATLAWHQRPGLGFIVLLCFSFGLIVLIRPSNIIISLVFLLYGVYNGVSFRQKMQFFRPHIWQLAAGLAILILMALPQLLYWKQQTGNLFYYSYSGERFFFGHPHIFDGFFSFRKGWLLYTPIIALGLIGFGVLRRYAKELFIPILVYVLLNIWVVLSWWCWWYGGGFGLRAFIESYAFLSLPLAALWRWAFEKGWLATTSVVIFAFLCVKLNLFQSKQYREGMLHWDSMSKEVYMATFLKYEYIKDKDKMLIPPDYEAAKKGLPEKSR